MEILRSHYSSLLDQVRLGQPLAVDADSGQLESDEAMQYRRLTAGRTAFADVVFDTHPTQEATTVPPLSAFVDLVLR